MKLTFDTDRIETINELGQLLMFFIRQHEIDPELNRYNSSPEWELPQQVKQIFQDAVLGIDPDPNASIHSIRHIENGLLVIWAFDGDLTVLFNWKTSTGDFTLMNAGSSLKRWERLFLTE